MKIRNKLSIRYTAVTAAVFSVFIIIILLFSGKNRERQFYANLDNEALTKANLFFNGNVDANIMESIYKNNREFINEVEVAIYDMQHKLLYHDASDIDIVKETPEMLDKIAAKKHIRFYQDNYQVVGLVYSTNAKDYIVTAAAYDGYGHAKQLSLSVILYISWFLGLIILAISGYYLAKAALSPVSRIVSDMEKITGSNLHKRLDIKHINDELGELSATFNTMLQRLEKSFDSQKMFVSNIAHQLRTPLAALIAELELGLLKERTTDEYKKTIQHAIADAKELERLSSGMLDLARADYDPSLISMRELRLDEILLDARHIVMTANSNHKVELLFEQDTDDEKLITVIGNEYLLKTAFVNLMENNCKFSADNTSRVGITFLNDYSILHFSDTGIGINKNDLQQLFTPFFRGENSEYASGHGIGLAFVQRIILLHKGTIQVHSDSGEGTVFICEIPHI